MARDRRPYLMTALSHVRESLGAVVSQRAAVRLLNREKDALGIPTSVSATSVLEALIDAGRISAIVLDASPYAKVERLGIDDYDLFDVALSLRGPAAYFSHGTAVHLNGLTTDVPTTLYLNLEQSPKPAPTGPMTQAGIERAFGSHARESALTYISERGRVTILSGKNTGNADVGTARTISNRIVPTTKLERTLIDIAVRPNYAGGPFKVAEAYEAAVARGVSANALVACLDRVGHRYPYHQSIGFLLERAGAAPQVLDRLRSKGMELDFHLHHRIADPIYVKSWRLYVPRGL